MYYTASTCSNVVSPRAINNAHKVTWSIRHNQVCQKVSDHYTSFRLWSWVDAILSVDIPPTVELLVKELNIVTDWYVFGVALGVPVSTLNCIKSENSDVENKKIQMFQFWLQYKLDASWKLVIQALEQNNYLVLAATLSKKYLLSDSSNTTEEERGMSSRLPLQHCSVAMSSHISILSFRSWSVTTEVNESIEIQLWLRDYGIVLETSFTKMLTNLLRLLTECTVWPFRSSHTNFRYQIGHLCFGKVTLALSKKTK